MESEWNVGQLILLKEYADFSTIYVGSISHVYENRIVVIVVSESKPFVPRVVKIKNRVWESIIRDSDIQEGIVIIKALPIKKNFMVLFDAKTNYSV